MMEQCAPDGDLLAQSFGQLRGPGICIRCELEAIDQLADDAVWIVEWEQARIDGQVIANGQPVPEPGRLGQESNSVAQAKPKFATLEPVRWDRNSDLTLRFTALPCRSIPFVTPRFAAGR